MHELDALFRPRSIAVVGAGPNDPTRMGTRTLHDLVTADWPGQLYPVSSRHDTLYGRRVYRSLRELPEAPDVVLARTPSAGIEELVDDAVAARARFLIILAAGFAESGEVGRMAQAQLLARARQGGLRIVGPQSIGLVNCTERLPLSLSQIMERFELRPGPVALLTQSGAMAISLAVRGQSDLGLDFSCVATFGNSADVTPVEAMEWLATDPQTRVIGLYLEGLDDGERFAHAAARCRTAGQRIVILRSGMSVRGALAVQSHTASMAGDGDAFRALCRQLGVLLCDSAEGFLWSLKALAGTPLFERPRVAFASISGGACALWADRSEALDIALPALDDAQRALLAQRLPAFLAPSNPLDLGPAVFDAQAFEGALQVLLAQSGFNLVVLYLFTSSPSLMGGLQKIRQIERMARQAARVIWVIWEAATAEEWFALAGSDCLVAFRDLGQAARALADLSRTLEAPGFFAVPGPFEPACGAPAASRAPAHGEVIALDTEPAVKSWLRGVGLAVPQGVVCADLASAVRAAAHAGPQVALKIVSPDLPHKSDVGGVVLCGSGAEEVAASYRQMLGVVQARRPDARIRGVLVETRIGEPGLELFVTVRRDPLLGIVTVIGRGGVQIEVDRDLVVHVGALQEAQVPALLSQLRCAALLRGYRGRPSLAVPALSRTVSLLQAAVVAAAVDELEINPLLLTASEAWVLDALALTRGGA